MCDDFDSGAVSSGGGCGAFELLRSNSGSDDGVDRSGGAGAGAGAGARELASGGDVTLGTNTSSETGTASRINL